MDQLATAVIISYGTTYAVKYVFEYVTYSIFKKTTNKAKKIIKNAVYKRPKKPIEYQLIQTINNRVVFDEVTYVTSKERDQDELILLTTPTPPPQPTSSDKPQGAQK